MKRLLIFTVLFPPLALLVFSAPDAIAHQDFRLLDFWNLEIAYLIAAIPAWLSASVDWALPKYRIVGTTITGAVIAYVAAFSIGFPFGDYRATLMVGLVGAIPAAVCSWLSRTA